MVKIVWRQPQLKQLFAENTICLRNPQIIIINLGVAHMDIFGVLSFASSHLIKTPPNLPIDGYFFFNHFTDEENEVVWYSHWASKWWSQNSHRSLWLEHPCGFHYCFFLFFVFLYRFIGGRRPHSFPALFETGVFRKGLKDWTASLKKMPNLKMGEGSQKVQISSFKWNR